MLLMAELTTDPVDSSAELPFLPDCDGEWQQKKYLHYEKDDTECRHLNYAEDVGCE